MVILFQYYYVNELSKKYGTILAYSIAGGLFWVIYAVLLYFLHKYTQDVRLNIIISLIIIIIVSLIYYLLLKN